MKLGHFLRACAAVALMVGAQSANAVLVLTPATAGVIGANLGPSNCEPGCVNTQFGLTGASALVNPTDLLYKQNVGGSEEGSFAASYTATFNGDASGGTIVYSGGPSIACPSCYLAIKDGNQLPSYYFYNLSAWNGTETIELRGFWPNQGAISHVSIWGKGSGGQIPEPVTLGLLGVGLLALGAVRRRGKAVG